MYIQKLEKVHPLGYLNLEILVVGGMLKCVATQKVIGRRNLSIPCKVLFTYRWESSFPHGKEGKARRVSYKSNPKW